MAGRGKLLFKADCATSVAAGLALGLAVIVPQVCAAEDVSTTFQLPPQLSLQLSERWNARFDSEYVFDEPSFGSDQTRRLFERPSAAFLDWRPVGGGFRISGGYFTGLTEFDAAVPGTAGYDFRRLNTYGSPLSLSGRGSYLGVGWDGANDDPAGGWGFKLDLGLMFTGDGAVSESAESGAAEAIDPRFQSTRDFDAYRDFDGDGQYPVLSIGARYRW